MKMTMMEQLLAKVVKPAREKGVKTIKTVDPEIINSLKAQAGITSEVQTLENGKIVHGMEFAGTSGAVYNAITVWDNKGRVTGYHTFKNQEEIVELRKKSVVEIIKLSPEEFAEPINAKLLINIRKADTDAIIAPLVAADKKAKEDKAKAALEGKTE
jgi:hypothetical protein